MDEARDVLAIIIQDAEQRVASRLDSMEASARQLAWATSIGGISIALFSGAAFVIVARNTARPRRRTA